MRRKIGWFLNGFIILLSFVYLVFFLFAAMKRLEYPFELEWVEGGILLEVERLLSGQALYVAPSPAYVPFIYPPLYFYAAAAVSSLVGPGFTGLRLVSLGSTLITFLVIGIWVWKETRRVLPSLAAIGFYAGTYPLSGTWFDVGRVDAFFLMWVLLAALLVRFSTGALGGLLAGLTLSAAFFTKQTTLTIALPLLVYALFSPRLSSRVFLVTFVGITSVAVAILSVFSQGWFVYYIFYLPAHFQVLPSRLWRFWKVNMLAYVGMAFWGYLLLLAWDGLERQWERWGVYVALFVGMVGSAWLSWAHLGGYANDLMPAHALLAIGLGVFMAGGTKRFEVSDVNIAVPILVLLQLLTLIYSPRVYIPRARDRTAGENLVQRVRGLKGDVYIPFHPYLAERAGKEESAHVGAVADVVRGDPKGWGLYIRTAVRQGIRNRVYGVIILDTPGRIFIDEDTERLVHDYYRGPLRIFREEDVFFPVTGWRTRPERLYRR